VVWVREKKHTKLRRGAPRRGKKRRFGEDEKGEDRKTECKLHLQDGGITSKQGKNVSIKDTFSIKQGEGSLEGGGAVFFLAGKMRSSVQVKRKNDVHVLFG